MFSKVVLLSALFAPAIANVYFTNPTATTVMTADQLAEIQWQDDGKGLSLADFGPAKLTIAVGSAKQQTSVQTIIASVDVSTESTVKFKVDPMAGPDSSDYFVRCESLSARDPTDPQLPALAFSAKFKMTGMKGSFTPEILKQIQGQDTASLAGATPAPSSGSRPAATTTSSGAKTSSNAPSSTKSAANATKSNAAVTTKASWFGIVIGALVGASMF